MLGILIGGFILAWIFHPGQSEQSILSFVNKLGTKNKGMLIEPVDLNNVGITQQDGTKWQWAGIKNNKTLWSILVIVDGACDENCQQTIFDVHQVHKRLDKYASRVQRVIVFDDWNHTVESKGAFRVYWSNEQLNHTLPEHVSYQYYIVDPRGLAMMGYTGVNNPADILDDIKFLVTNSP